MEAVAHVRYEDVEVGHDYAVRWGYTPKGHFPLTVLRARVLHKDVETGVVHDKPVKGIEAVVLEVLSDNGQVPEFVFLRQSRSVQTKLHHRVTLEGARLFVAPWDEYEPQRHAEEEKRDAAEIDAWEARERRKLIGERLQALGFTVRPHGAPWRDGFVPAADYTVADARLSLDALDRLLLMAEADALDKEQTP